MAELTIEQALDLAMRHHRAGRLGEAEQVYRSILVREPENVDALHFLGVIAHQSGHHGRAAELIGRSIEIRPGDSRAHNNLGLVLWKLGRLDGAIAAHRQAIALNPNSAEAHNNLGNILRLKGQLDEAVAECRRAIGLRSEFAEACGNLGNALLDKGELDEAIAAYLRAIEIDPNHAEAHGNLGNALQRKGKFDEAIAAYRKAIALRPGYADGHYNLGNVLNKKGLLDEAVAQWQEAIAERPDYARAYSNLGNARRDQGRLDDAMDCYRKAVELRPHFVSAHSYLVYTASFHPFYDSRRILSEARQWANQQARDVPKFLRHDNNRDPQRRLKVGYVSPDFREHPVGRFLLPLLANHNSRDIECYCYSDVTRPDAITRRLRESAHVWRNTNALNDVQLAEQARQDGIDILVDLTLHMAGSRLLVFAHKPAPVQVTYLGYCGTTGLAEMDYRLSDIYLDPPELGDEFYSEKTIRLAGGYWCYPEPEDAQGVAPLPAMNAEVITLGCFNNFCKVTGPTIECWTELMRGLPGSRLVVHSHEGEHRQRFLKTFADGGIDSARVEFCGSVPGRKYFERFNEVDIALDPFPYGGGTTTCDALWMGVPVITLAGDRAVGRGGVSILNKMGLVEWIAHSREQYIELARKWAADLPGLAAVRQGLRKRMIDSPLMNGRDYTAGVEEAYRAMWRAWCRGDV